MHVRDAARRFVRSLLLPSEENAKEEEKRGEETKGR